MNTRECFEYHLLAHMRNPEHGLLGALPRPARTVIAADVAQTALLYAHQLLQRCQDLPHARAVILHCLRRHGLPAKWAGAPAGKQLTEALHAERLWDQVVEAARIHCAGPHGWRHAHQLVTAVLHAMAWAASSCVDAVQIAEQLHWVEKQLVLVPLFRRYDTYERLLLLARWADEELGTGAFLASIREAGRRAHPKERGAGAPAPA